MISLAQGVEVPVVVWVREETLRKNDGVGDIGRYTCGPVGMGILDKLKVHTIILIFEIGWKSMEKNGTGVYNYQQYGPRVFETLALKFHER